MSLEASSAGASLPSSQRGSLGQVSLRSSNAHGMLADEQQLVAESAAVNVCPTYTMARFRLLQSLRTSPSGISRVAVGYGSKSVSLSRIADKMGLLSGNSPRTRHSWSARHRQCVP